MPSRGQSRQVRPPEGHRRHQEEAEGRREAPRHDDRRRLRRDRPAHRRRRRLPPGQGLVGAASVQRRRPGLDRRARVGLRRHREEERRGRAATTGPPASRSPTRTRRRRSARTGTRAASRPRRSTSGSTPRRPPRARGARAQPRARLHDPLVRRDHRRRPRQADRDRGHRQEARRQRQQLPVQVHRRSLDVRRREGEQGVPGGPAHRVHALGGRRQGTQGIWQYCSEPSGEALASS